MSRSPIRYFKTSFDVTRLAVMTYIRFPLSLRNLEDLLHECGIDICHETVRYWWNRFSPLFAAEIRKCRIYRHLYLSCRWNLDEAFVRINGDTYCLWRAVDHEGKMLGAFVTKTRDQRAPFPRSEVKLIMRRAGGSIIGPRIRISLSDEENRPRQGFDVLPRYRNLSPRTAQFTITSIVTTTSIAETPSSSSVPPPCSNGGSFMQHELDQVDLRPVQ